MAKSKEKLVPVEGGVIPERDAGTPPVLEARHLGIDFGGLTAVDDFNFIIGKTEIGGLIGPNGAGKTTIFNLLTNVYQPTRGKILIGGVDTRGKKTYEVNRMGIARTCLLYTSGTKGRGRGGCRLLCQRDADVLRGGNDDCRGNQ